MTKTSVATPSLSVRLTYGDGTTETIPVDFDFSNLTVDQLQQIHRLNEGSILDELEPTPRLVAICLFVKLDRPDDDFALLGPLLADFAAAKADIEITGLG